MNNLKVTIRQVTIPPEVAAILSDIVTDPRFQGFAVALFNTLWIHFVPPQYSDLQVILDGGLAIVLGAINARAVMQSRQARLTTAQTNIAAK